MDEAEIAAQRPHDIDSALDAMQTTLEYYHAHNDNRAIFLRLYYIMTLEVHKAINQYGDYAGKEIFIDPDWIRELSGRFATKYFESLTPATRSRAWVLADQVAERPHSAIVENALLGINAHINFDLPRAIGENLKPAELDQYRRLQLRKFDHDQVNNLLIRVLNQIQTTLAEDYEPGIGIADALMGNIDELASGELLKVYRERVWWNALTFASAKVDGKDELVRDKLDWESAHLAKDLMKARWLWSEERLLNVLAAPLSRGKNWASITLERPMTAGHRP